MKLRSPGKGNVGLALLVCLALAIPVGLVVTGMTYQARYRAFVYALSEATVAAYEHNDLKASWEETQVRVTGDNGYDVYFLFTKKQARRRSRVPEGLPNVTLEYGSGARLECWSIRLEPGARRSYGIFWRFTDPAGRQWLYDTDDLALYHLERILSAEKNPLWDRPAGTDP